MDIKKLAVLLIAWCLTFSFTYAATVDDYTRLPEREKVSVSPDGSKVVFQQNTDGRRMAIIYDVDNKQLIKAFDLEQLNARQVYFLTDNIVLFKVSELTRVQGVREGQYSMSHIYNIKKDKIRPTMVLGERIIKGQQGMGSVIGLSDDGKYAFMPAYINNGSIVDWDIRYSVMRVNLRINTEPKLVFAGSRYTEKYIVDKDGEVLAQMIMEDERDKLIIKARVGKKLTTIYEEKTERPTKWLIGINADRTHLYITERNSANRNIRLMSIETGEISDPILALPDKDIGRVFTNSEDVVLGVHYHGFRPTYRFFDEELNTRVKDIQAMFPGQSVSIISLSDDLKKLVVSVEGTQNAGDYFLFREGKAVFFIGSQRPDISPEEIHPQASWGFKASDGLRIPVLMTIPADRVANISPMPTVVLPHGGPASYDKVGFDWLTQSLANEGYLVVQPQFRGSIGFGNKHYFSGQGEWGQKMQDDVTESVKALIKKGYVDANNVCIMGWSYGGYSALAGGAFTPDMYRCVVSINGVSDLHALLVNQKKEYSRNSWVVDYWEAQMAGDDKPTAAYLKSISPADHADKFKAPVLLIHGEDDRVVRSSQAKTMASALDKAGNSVELHVIEGDGHSLIQQGSRIEMMNYILPFLDKHLSSAQP